MSRASSVMSLRRFARDQDSCSVPTPPSAHPGTRIFATTIFADLPGALFRFAFGWWLGSSQHNPHQSAWPAFVAILCAATPYLWALLTLRFGGGAHLTLFYHLVFSNARRPSTSESKQIAAILQQFARLGAITPRRCFVIDTGNFNAWVQGTTLYLERTLFDTPYLTAVIAHELGHLGSTDGRWALARSRLLIPPLLVDAPAFLRQLYVEDALNQQRAGKGPSLGMWLLCGALSWSCWLMGGGLGLVLTERHWRAYWKAREYAADDYAARLGYADDLADALSDHFLADDPLILLSSPGADTHPPTDERIARLREYGRS